MVSGVGDFGCVFCIISPSDGASNPSSSHRIRHRSLRLLHQQTHRSHLVWTFPQLTSRKRRTFASLLSLCFCLAWRRRCEQYFPCKIVFVQLALALCSPILPYALIWGLNIQHNEIGEPGATRGTPHSPPHKIVQRLV